MNFQSVSKLEFIRDFVSSEAENAIIEKIEQRARRRQGKRLHKLKRKGKLFREVLCNGSLSYQSGGSYAQAH